MTNDQQLMTKYRELRDFVADMIHDDTLNESDDPETCRSALKLLDEIDYEEKQANTGQQDGKSTYIEMDKLSLVFSGEDGSHINWSVTEVLDAGIPIDPDTGDDLEFVGACLDTA